MTIMIDGLAIRCTITNSRQKIVTRHLCALTFIALRDFNKLFLSTFTNVFIADVYCTTVACKQLLRIDELTVLMRINFVIFCEADAILASVVLNETLARMSEFPCIVRCCLIL